MILPTNFKLRPETRLSDNENETEAAALFELWLSVESFIKKGAWLEERHCHHEGIIN